MKPAEEAKALAQTLQRREARVVLAESCTAGLVSAMLARVPGISQWHCGAAVTYREATKVAWLDVSASAIRQHTAVSEPVAREMATGVLSKTPEATFSAAITGHLGPDAPAKLDGVVYISVATRRDGRAHITGVWRHKLKSGSRYRRQQEAAALVLRRLTMEVRKSNSSSSSRRVASSTAIV